MSCFCDRTSHSGEPEFKNICIKVRKPTAAAVNWQRFCSFMRQKFGINNRG
jgi:hypothetical protein